MQFWLTLRISCNCNTPPEPCHRRDASPRPGSASASQGRDCHASMTPLPTHPFGVVRRHEQVRSWLTSTSPFFALRRVQTSTSRANERRRIHSTFPAMFGLLRPANAAAHAGEWECKSYVCISCQTYTPTLSSRSSRSAMTPVDRGATFAVTFNPTFQLTTAFCLKACLGPVLVPLLDHSMILP
jgi:hypothetical protein